MKIMFSTYLEPCCAFVIIHFKLANDSTSHECDYFECHHFLPRELRVIANGSKYVLDLIGHGIKGQLLFQLGNPLSAR